MCKKVEISNVNPPKLFSVDSFDMKSLSFKIGNHIFINFEMPSGHLENQHFVAILSICFRGPWVKCRGH